MVGRLGARLGCAAVLLASTGSCGSKVRAHEAGQSTHFRLFIGDDLEEPRPTGDLLSSLETNWADTKTILEMPEGKPKINYYLLTTDQVNDVCGNPDAEGCEVEGTVYASLDIDQHELNHAYTWLTAGRLPAPLLVEGVAEAVGCGFPASTNEVFDPDWRKFIDYHSYGSVYDPGREFVRYLVLTFGGAEFVRYYGQAPETKAPETFADNFAAFWGIDLDSVWAEVGRTLPQWGAYPICPCSLPPWTATGDPTPIEETSNNPYWTWPNVGDDTTAWSGGFGSVFIADCHREVFNSPASHVTFARLDGPYYAYASHATVARGSFLADTCEAARPYGLDANLIAIEGQMRIVIATPQPTATHPVYLSLSAPGPGMIVPVTGFGDLSICTSCDFTAPDCQPAAPSVPISVPEVFYVRWDLPTGAVVPAMPTRDFTWAPAASP
jgi:hypothetical protein